MQRVKLSLACLLSLSLAGVAWGQTAVDPTSDSGVISLQDYSGGATLGGSYFDLRHQSGPGVGHDDGYSQVGVFTPFWLGDDSFIAPNTRLLLPGNGNVGVSTGLVGRHYLVDTDRIFGLNAYFDSDVTGYDNRYNQIGFGLESLGQWWDFRANGYIALGDRDRHLADLCVGGDPYFTNNMLAFLGAQLREESMSGGDFEFGLPVFGTTPWFRAYAGMYAYQAKGADPVGVRGRLEAWVSDDLSIGVNVSQDKNFGTNVNAVVQFLFSGYRQTRYFPQFTTQERMLTPVQRNWRTSTGTYTKYVDVAAINPDTNLPYFVTHVRGGATPGGDGTFERPFNALPESAPGDLILVHRGNSTLANPIMGSIKLADRQRLLGEGKAHFTDLYARYGACSVSGSYTLPGFTNSGLYPFLSSTGSIIMLSDNNEVSALNLVNAGGSAIVNSPAGSHNFLLQCLEITGNQGRGISLTNASGTGIIRGINYNSGTLNHANSLGYGNNLGGGVFVDSAGPGLNLTMTDVAMNSSPAGTSPFGVWLLADDAALTARMNNIFVNGNGTGIRLRETSQPLAVSMDTIRASGNTGVGIQVSGVGGSIDIIGNNIAANDNGLDNLQIGTVLAPIVTSTVNVSLSDIALNRSVAGSGAVMSLSGGTGNLQFPTGLYASGNGVDGLQLNARNQAVMNVGPVTQGDLSRNGRDAFHVTANTGSVIALDAMNIDATYSGRHGLFYDVRNSSVFNTNFTNVDLNFSGQNPALLGGGIRGAVNNFSAVNTVFNQTWAINSAADGMFVQANNNSSANIVVVDGNFSNSGQLAPNAFDGVRIDANLSTVSLVMDNTPSMNIRPNYTQRNGLHLNILNQSVFTGLVTNGNFSDNFNNAIRANVLGGSIAVLDVQNTPSNYSGADGFFANVDASALVTNVINSDFNFSGSFWTGNGLELSATNGAFYQGVFDNSSFFCNVVNGMHAVVTGASLADITLINGSIVDQNGEDGFGFLVDGSQLNLTAVDSSFSNNGKFGVIGNGITGAVHNSGLVNLNLANTPVNSNLSNGIFINTTNLSNVVANLDNSPVNGNGLTTNGDGIRLDLDNSPASQLVMTNGSTVIGNGGDGIELNATNNTFFIGAFANMNISDNGQTSGTGDGFRTNVDASTVLLTFDTVNLINLPPNATQQDGFEFNVQNAGQLAANFSNSSLSDNLQNAIRGNVNGLGSVGVIALNNSAGNRSGAEGALLNVNNFGFLDFSMTNGSSLDDSTASGAAVSVTNNSLMNFSITDFSQILRSGVHGFEANVTTNSTLNFTGTNGSSISNNGGSGMLTNVDGIGSVANFDIRSMTIDNNGFAFGGEGFNGTAVNGGTLNACIIGTSISTNANQGIELTVDGIDAANRSTANVHTELTNVNDNGGEGLLATITNFGTLNYRSVNSTYDINGVNGTLDGVHVEALGSGPANSAEARLLFSGGSINANTDDGVELVSLNGAMLTAELTNGITVNNNGTALVNGYGVNLTTNGANTTTNLLMTGTAPITGNGLGSFNLNVAGPMQQVVLKIPGTASGAAGDGINLTLDQIVTAIVDIEGPGNIDGNGANGIFIRMSNVTNGSILVNGVTSISNNTLDGIHIEMENVANGAVGIFGATDIFNSGDDAIDISLINTNLVNNFNIPLGAIDGLTLNDNLPSPLNGCLPVPVLIDVNSLGLTPTQAFIINGVAIDGSTNRGINVFAQNTNIAPDGSFITNNQIDGSQNGDGLHLDFDTVSADGLLIGGNGAGLNSANGFNFDFLNSPIDRMQVINNRIGGSVNTGLNFFITGNTFTDPFTITNTSDPGINILGFQFDVGPSIHLFDTVEPQGSTPFQPQNNTDTITGLVSVNGTLIAQGTNPIEDTMGNVLVGGGVADDTTLIDLTFNDFNPGESFQWVIDVDPPGGTAGVFGNELINSTVNVQFSGGLTLGGTLVAVAADPTASQFVATSGNTAASGIVNNGLDGIRFNLNGSNLTNLLVDNNQIDSNGSAAGVGNGNGIEFIALNSDISINPTISNNAITNNDGHGIVFTSFVNGQLGPINVNNNSITDNRGDGFRMVGPVTTNSSIGLVFNQNTISQNTGTGVNLNLVAGAQHLNAEFNGNTVNENAGGPGVNIALADNRNTVATFRGNTINLNAAEGVNFAPGVNGKIFADFVNNTINGNASHGIDIPLQTGGQFVSSAFWGNTIGAEAARNGGMGVRLIVPDQASYNWMLGNSDQAANNIAGNTDAGVGIDMTGNSGGILTVMNTNFLNTVNGADPSFNGEGLAIHLNDTAHMVTPTRIGDGTLDNTTFQNNVGDGFQLVTRGNSQAVGTIVRHVQSLNNGGDGLDFQREDDSILDSTYIHHNVITGNAHGVNLLARPANFLDRYAFEDNTISNNRLNGINARVEADADMDLLIIRNTIDNNGNDGINISERFNAVTDSRMVTGHWRFNSFSNNGGDGVDIQARHTIQIGDAVGIGVFENTISGNGGNGILVDPVGKASLADFSSLIVNNTLIENNTLDGVLINSDVSRLNVNASSVSFNGGTGVHLNSTGATLLSSVTSNTIMQNGADGVEILNTSGILALGGAGQIEVINNTIFDNAGRGVDILNRGNGTAAVDVRINQVLQNGAEGVYVVNTASNTQTQVSNSTALVADGSVFAAPDLLFNMIGNTVLDNGRLSAFDTTGFVLRVGTADATTSIVDQGGFSSGNDNINPFAANVAQVLSGRAGVLADIQNNTFGGSFGHDVAIESFVSTVNPNTGVAWTDQNEAPPNPANDIFNPAGYQSDPLARLDLRFLGNVGEDANVTRDGAFYNNADPIFKSRINTPGATTSPPGPFTSGSRSRNAQRLASRDAPFGAPFFNIGASGFFLYPGVGESTFRVTSDSNTAGFTTTDTFGSAVGLGGLFGELPFVWDQTLAP